MGLSPNSVSPMAILDKARKAVPAVNYALGVAGVAAAAALVTLLVGNTTSSLILLSSSFVGMVLLFVFSKLVVSPAPSIQFAGIVLVWMILAFFATFLVFTTTAFVSGWPCNWAGLLGLNQCAAQKQSAVEPPSTHYGSPDLGVAFDFPTGILVLDTTEENQRKLTLKDSDGREIVKITRTALPEQKDVKVARESEIAELEKQNITVTMIAPKKESNWSNWYALSGVSQKTVFYFRRWYCPDSMLSMEFRFAAEPAERVQKFERAINKMTLESTRTNCG